jgi:hypothetical protein
MTNEQIIELQAERRRFAETEAGAALIKYERLLAHAWQADCRDGGSDKRLREVWAASDAAGADLIRIIKDLQATASEASAELS